VKRDKGSRQMGHLSKAGVLTVRLVQIPRGEGFEFKNYKKPRDVTVEKKI